jgi:hypothetical protein
VKGKVNGPGDGDDVGSNGGDVGGADANAAKGCRQV